MRKSFQANGNENDKDAEKKKHEGEKSLGNCVRIYIPFELNQLYEWESIWLKAYNEISVIPKIFISETFDLNENSIGNSSNAVSNHVKNRKILVRLVCSTRIYSVSIEKERTTDFMSEAKLPLS